MDTISHRWAALAVCIYADVQPHTSYHPAEGAFRYFLPNHPPPGNFSHPDVLHLCWILGDHRPLHYLKILWFPQTNFPLCGKGLIYRPIKVASISRISISVLIAFSETNRQGKPPSLGKCLRLDFFFKVWETHSPFCCLLIYKLLPADPEASGRDFKSEGSWGQK